MEAKGEELITALNCFLKHHQLCLFPILSCLLQVTLQNKGAAAHHILNNRRALNEIKYVGPLSVEWEDPGVDREEGRAT